MSKQRSFLSPSKETWGKAALIWLACLINGQILESVFSELFPEPTPIAIIIVIGGGLFALYYSLALEMQLISWLKDGQRSQFSFTISPKNREQSLKGIVLLLIVGALRTVLLPGYEVLRLLDIVTSAYLHHWLELKQSEKA